MKLIRIKPYVKNGDCYLDGRRRISMTVSSRMLGEAFKNRNPHRMHHDVFSIIKSVQ